MRATYLTTILYLGSGVIGTLHHLYFPVHRLLLQQWERSFSLGSGSPDADWFRGVEDAETISGSRRILPLAVTLIATCFGI